MSPNVIIQESAAEPVGQYILKLQNEALLKSSTFNIAVLGGSLGKVLRQSLVENPSIAPQIQWEKWNVYFSDERLVPLDHSDSNYGLFHEMVLLQLPNAKNIPKVFTIEESLLTGIDGQVKDSSPTKDEQIADSYAKVLPAKFDLILLGCGPDGHTCSLFPGHSLLKEQNKLVAALADSPKPPPRRITFTFPVLENARNIAFVAEGDGKKEILKEIFSDSSQLPCATINKLENVSWFVNPAAVKDVSF